jgi:hypothetical protein
MKIYLAGPMSGIPQFNFPAFEEAATAMRATGIDVVSPHEQDAPETRAMAWASPDGVLTKDSGAESWGTCLSRDVKIVADEVTGVVFLPGWQRSRGAKLEALTALMCGHSFFAYEAGTVTPLTTDHVRSQLKKFI